jgi:indolepyruvate ferredoxin oxidoreductase beta subunit
MTIGQDPLNLIICGVGGQGNILIASLLAASLNRKNYHVTVGDTFGAAQRGGAVFSSVRISSLRPYGPLIPKGRAHIILGLEPLETLRLLIQYGNPDVICLTNTYPIYPVGVMAKNLRYPNFKELERSIAELSKFAYFVKATEMAVKLGMQISMNVIMLGALIGSKQVPLKKRDIEEEMRKTFPSSRLKINLRAFEAGINAMHSQIKSE